MSLPVTELYALQGVGLFFLLFFFLPARVRGEGQDNKTRGTEQKHKPSDRDRSANPKDEQQMVRSLAEEMSAPTTNNTPADKVLANKDAVVVQSTHLTAAAAKGQVARQATPKHAVVGKIPINEAVALVVQAPHEKHPDISLRSSSSTQEQAVAEYPDNCMHTAGMIDHCLMEIPSSKVTLESIFALIDIDQSGSVNIEEISNAIGQDLRDRGQLQELLPDLMSGLPSYLFVIAQGDPAEPHKVNVTSEHWVTYWLCQTKPLQMAKLFELQRLISETAFVPSADASGAPAETEDQVDAAAAEEVQMDNLINQMVGFTAKVPASAAHCVWFWLFVYLTLSAAHCHSLSQSHSHTHYHLYLLF